MRSTDRAPPGPGAHTGERRVTETRSISESDRARYEGYIGEILTAFGMHLSDPGTRSTPRRWLKAPRESTTEYQDDPILRQEFRADIRTRDDS